MPSVAFNGGSVKASSKLLTSKLVAAIFFFFLVAAIDTDNRLVPCYILFSLWLCSISFFVVKQVCWVLVALELHVKDRDPY